MKKILLPTDFSENAWNAITYALDFFKNEKCEFHILHTYTPTFYRVDYMMGGPTYSAIPDMGVDIAQAGLDKTLLDINLQFKNPRHRFRTLSAFNMLTDEIRELTQNDNYDLIIMGTQGATGAKEIFLGTHTVHIIRKSKIPVMAVPEGYIFKEIKSIVFPTDYRSLYKKEEIDFLIDIVKMFMSKLVILHVKEDYDFTDDQIANKKALTAYFKDINHVFVEERGKLMPDAIHDYINLHDSGLLAMMNRKHSFLERLLIKQNIDSIGFHTKVPFLVMRDTAPIKSRNIK